MHHKEKSYLECFYEIEKKNCFLVCTKQKQIHATWASTIRSVGPGYTPPFAARLLFLFGLLSLVCPVSFHQSFLLLDTAFGSVSCCLAPFLFYPFSLWKTLCPPVLKFRSEGEMSWQHFLGLLPLHLDVSKTSPSGRSSPEPKSSFVYSVPNNRRVVRMTVFNIILITFCENGTNTIYL